MVCATASRRSDLPDSPSGRPRRASSIAHKQARSPSPRCIRCPSEKPVPTGPRSRKTEVQRSAESPSLRPPVLVSLRDGDELGLADRFWLIVEADDEMRLKRVGEPPQRRDSRWVLPALDPRDDRVAGAHALRELLLR